MVDLVKSRNDIKFVVEIFIIVFNIFISPTEISSFKEIRRAKEKPIYIRYITEVPKVSRVKGIHPRTPNKFLNFSRRSWDAQVNFELFCINLIA